MRIILLSISFCALLISCSKSDFKGEVKNTTIQGRVFDSSSRSGMAYVPVNIYWVGRGMQETRIATLMTDGSGFYSGKIPVEVNRFTDGPLNVEAVVPNGYISGYDLEQRSIGASIVGIYAETMEMPRFAVYQPAPLTIQVNRTQTDPFTSLEIVYNYGGRDYTLDPGKLSSNGSGSFNVITGAEVPTTIKIKKTLTSGQVTTITELVSAKLATSSSVSLQY